MHPTASRPGASAGRRILLASYHFPPDAAVGALRLGRFARFLPEFGWDPCVLTVRDDLREQGIDESRMAGLDHVKVIRTGELPRVIETVGRLKSVVKRAALGAPSAAGVARVATDGSAGGEAFGARLKRWALSLLILLPDEQKNWSIYAAVTAIRLVRTELIDWVLTSGPPFSVHVIGLATRSCTKARWIADFRDPWIDMLPTRHPHLRSRLSDRLERWMEAAVVRSADRVLTTTDRMRQAMAARYPHVPAEKFVCVPNGVDNSKVRANTPAEKFEPFTITYAGALYFDRTPEPLFEAVRELIASGAATPSAIRIKLVGQCRYIGDVLTEQVARSYGLGDVVEVLDRVPHDEALRIMERSHLLLMLAPERHELVVPAKIFDYFGSGAAVLAIAEPGATADLMRDAGCGRCFSRADIAGLRDYLDSLLRDGAYRNLSGAVEVRTRYDARALTGRVAAEIGDVDAGARPAVMAHT